jgi:YVTN family beta-propeller protein
LRFFCALLLIIAVLVFGLALPGYAIWHCGDIPLPGAPHAIIRDPVTCDFFVTTSDAHLVRIDEATNALTQTDLPAVGTALAFDPASGLLYVVHEAADMVSVVDIGTGGSAPVDVGDSPRGIAVDAVRGLAFVVNSGDSTIFVLGGATVVDTLKCAGRPWAVVADPTSGKGVALLEDAGLLLVFDHSSGDTSYYGTGLNPVAAEIDPERGEVYVANSGQNAITVFRIDSDSVFAVPVGAPARCLALNPETHRLFVGMTSNSVTIVDTDTYATQTVGLASAPGHLAVDGLSNRCFVSLDGTGTLVEIGPGGDTLVVTVDGTLDGMIVNPVTNKCYVCNSGARGISILEAADYTGVRVAARGGPGPVAINLETHQVYTPNWYTGGVTVIDGYTNSRSTIPTADGPNALRIDPVSDDLYVVCAWANKLTIKRSASPDTLLANIGRYAHGLGLNLNTGKAYVSNRFSRDLSVIDMQTLDTTLVRTGAYPCDVAVNMETNRIYTPNRTLQG